MQNGKVEQGDDGANSNESNVWLAIIGGILGAACLVVMIAFAYRHRKRQKPLNRMDHTAHYIEAIAVSSPNHEQAGDHKMHQ